MNVEGRKCREHIFATRMTEEITFNLKHSDPLDLKKRGLSPIILSFVPPPNGISGKIPASGKVMICKKKRSGGTACKDSQNSLDELQAGGFECQNRNGNWECF